MFKFFKNFVGQKPTANKSLIYGTSSLVCVSIAYLLNSNQEAKNLITNSTVHAFENDLEKKKLECKKLVKRFKEEHGIPGIIVGVSIDGENSYQKAFGYSDVENNHKANENTIMRIASISKPITTAIGAKLFELNKLDLDKSVNDYLSYLPVFKWNEKNVIITARQLMSHTSGIRHYDKDIDLFSTNKNDNKTKSGDSKFKEFFIKEHFNETSDALSIFMNDKLLFEPNTNYYYTTYGFTLLSAVLEKVGERTFPQLLNELFKYLDMTNTFIDENNPLIPNRSKYYTRNEKGRLENVPYVDNSYKWAGGGVLSTVGDLTKFANHLLYSYQNDNENNYLKQNTIKNYLWSKQSSGVTNRKDNNEKPPLKLPREKTSYGLGWFLCHDKNEKLKRVYHTGGAVGCTSCLMIIPNDNNNQDSNPSGIVVAVLCNLDNATGIANLTYEIAKIFSE